MHPFFYCIGRLVQTNIVSTGSDPGGIQKIKIIKKREKKEKKKDNKKREERKRRKGGWGERKTRTK